MINLVSFIAQYYVPIIILSLNSLYFIVLEFIVSLRWIDRLGLGRMAIV